eukprot:8923610-Alexandrium_andersonii.AAC.1
MCIRDRPPPSQGAPSARSPGRFVGRFGISNNSAECTAYELRGLLSRSVLGPRTSSFELLKQPSYFHDSIHAGNLRNRFRSIR